MILISSSQSDYSTTKVIDYLVINKAKFLLLNENSKIENLDVQFVDNFKNTRVLSIEVLFNKEENN